MIKPDPSLGAWLYCYKSLEHIQGADDFDVSRIARFIDSAE